MPTPRSRDAVLRRLERFRQGRQIDIQRALREGAVTRADLQRAGLTEEARRRQRTRQQREPDRETPQETFERVQAEQPEPETAPTPTPAQQQPSQARQALSRLQDAGVVAVDGTQLTVEDLGAALEAGHRDDLLAVGFTAEQLEPEPQVAPEGTPEMQALDRLQQAGVAEVEADRIRVEDVESALEAGHREDLLAVGFTQDQLAPVQQQIQETRERASFADRVQQFRRDFPSTWSLSRAAGGIRQAVAQGWDPDAPNNERLAARRGADAMADWMTGVTVARDNIRHDIRNAEQTVRVAQERQAESHLGRARGDVARAVDLFLQEHPPSRFHQFRGREGRELARQRVQGNFQNHEELLERGQRERAEAQERLREFQQVAPEIRTFFESVRQDQIRTLGGDPRAQPITNIEASIQAGTSPLVQEGLAEVTDTGEIRVNVGEAARQGFRDDLRDLGFTSRGITEAEGITTTTGIGPAATPEDVPGPTSVSRNAALARLQQAGLASVEGGQARVQVAEAARQGFREDLEAAGFSDEAIRSATAQQRTLQQQRSDEFRDIPGVRMEGDQVVVTDMQAAIAAGARPTLEASGFSDEAISEALQEQRQRQRLGRQLEEFATASQFQTFETPPGEGPRREPRFATQLQEEAATLSALRELEERGFTRDGGILVQPALRGGVPIETLRRAGVSEQAIEEGLEGQPTSGPTAGPVPQPRAEEVPEQAVDRFQQVFDALRSGVDLGTVEEVPESQIEPDRTITLKEEEQAFVGGTPALPLAGVPVPRVPRLPGLPQVQTPLGTTATTVAIGAAAITAEVLRRNPELRARLSAEAQQFADQVFQSTQRTQVTPQEVSPPGFAQVQPDISLPGASVGTPPETAEIPPQRVEPPPLPGTFRQVPPEIVRVLDRSNEVIEAERELTDILAPVDRARVTEALEAARAATEGQTVAVPIDQVIDQALQNAPPETRRRARTHLAEVEQRRLALEEAQRSLVASQGFEPGNANNPSVLRAAAAGALAGPTAAALAQPRPADLPSAGAQPAPALAPSISPTTGMDANTLTQQATGVARALDAEGQTSLANQVRTAANAATSPRTGTLSRTQPLQRTLTRVASNTAVSTRTATRAANLSRTLTGLTARTTTTPLRGGPRRVSVPLPDTDREEAPAPQGQHPRLVGINTGATDLLVDLQTGKRQWVKDSPLVPERAQPGGFAVLSTSRVPAGAMLFDLGAFRVAVTGQGINYTKAQPFPRRNRSRQGLRPRRRL